MKKLIFSAILFCILFSSCTSKDDETTAPPTVSSEISGLITSNKTFVLGTYTLKGIVKIESGATVTFEAGSTITCDKTTGDNALLVKNGGKLIVNGTAAQPVIFTEKSEIAGSWGGIIMYGDAPINAIPVNGVGSPTSTSEDGNALPYGGTNSAHNGGSLKYVQVRYAGSKLADGTKENNGFTFYSCGSGTTLDHLVAYKGADDGYEFFGGTVSMTNAISYGNFDDAFDWQDGWKGQANSNWYAYQINKGNFGMEIECSNNNNSYFPIITNITLKRAASCTPEVAGDIQVDAFQFKKEGNGEFSNIVIDGYGNYPEGTTVYNGAAVKIQDATTNTNQVNGLKIKLTNIKITNTSLEILGAKTGNPSVPISVVFPTGQFTTSITASGASLLTGAWSKVGSSELIQ